ncbi:MAG: RecX family transcriptional regulator [Tissierellales bacterium]|nr:RecX family transcriptional regulator [Tissierellales bacterium]MBN2827788.1 RecX family transcriptional regulator [Tissierellales bacterium]
MIITKIEKQKKNEHRVSIYIDNQFAFGLDSDTSVQCGLFEGQEIDDEFLHSVIVEEEHHKALNAALNLLSYQQRTLHEIDERLKAKGYDEGIIGIILDKLVEVGYLNDEKYVADFIRDKIKLKKYGSLKIRHQLMNRGIDQELISNGLEKIEELEMLNNAKTLIRKKAVTLKDLEEHKKKARLYRYLAGKGYDYPLIHKAINEFNEED